MIFTNCWMCGTEIAVNNYDDHKPRVKHLRVGGHIICPWCKSRGGIAREFVKLVLLAERTAKMPCEVLALIYPDEAGEQEAQQVDSATCKCTPCTAARILASLDLTPERFYRKRTG